MAKKENIENYFNNIKSNEDVNIENAKDIMITSSQAIAFHKIVRDRLEKEKKLYSKEDYDEIYEKYFLTMICLMRADKIEDYITKYSEDGGQKWD